MQQGPVRVEKAGRRESSGVIGAALAIGFGMGVLATLDWQRRATRVEAAEEPPAVVTAAAPAVAIPCGAKPGDPDWVIVTLRKPDGFARTVRVAGVAVNRDTEQTRPVFSDEFDPLWPCGKEE